MSNSAQEQIIYDKLINELKKYVAKNNTLTIASIECELSIENEYACNEHLTVTLKNHHIDKILIWPDTHINFEVRFNDDSIFLTDNKQFTKELLQTGHSSFILNMTHNSTVEEVLDMIAIIFSDNTKIQSILSHIEYVKLF